MGLKNSDTEEAKKQCSATIAGLIGIAPRDKIEGMLAAQLAFRLRGETLPTG